MTTVDTNNFEAIVLKSTRPVLVDFYTDWCAPCQMLSPVIEDMAADHPEMDIVKCNIDENLELAFRYRATDLPTLLLFKDGIPVKKASGYRERQEIEPYFCG